jgi:cardiolipin synthase
MPRHCPGIYIRSMSNYRTALSAELIFSGTNYFETLKEMIRESRDCIHIQTYILEQDKTGRDILQELGTAVKRGVNVYLLADGYGSRSITNKDAERICSTGINFRLFSTFFSSESIYRGRRLHHKIVVTDRHTALIGGINIADKYRGTETETAWLDYSVLIRGAICQELHELCEAFYHKRKLRPVRIRREEDAHVKLRFIRNDWIMGRNQIHKTYRKKLYSSKEKVVFVASYFLPGYRFRKALKSAKARGVEIHLVLAGRSDMPFLFYAEKYFYPFFLQNGIRIFEWKNSVMHAKAVLADEDWITIGSYNMNPVSHYLSIELNAEIKDKAFASAFKDHIDEIIRSSCTEITSARHYNNGFWSRMRNSMMYYFFKFIFLVFISRKR